MGTSYQNVLPPQRKYVIVKKSEEKSSTRNRIAHEKIILTKIKDGMSMFLPKYYINVDKNSDN